MSSISRAHPIRRLIVLLLATAALVGGVAVLTTNDRAAGDSVTGDSVTVSHQLRPGLGFRLPGGDFVGSYLTGDGLAVYCLEPAKAAPTGVWLSTVQRYGEHTAATTAALAYALTLWGDTHTRWAAAVESQVVNTLVGNTAAVQRRARLLPAAVNSSVGWRVRQAQQLHGPYSVHVTAPAVLPGQSGRATVRVISAAGYAVPGVLLSLHHSSNAAMGGWSRTGADGVATIGYGVTGTGPVTINATALGLPAAAIAVSSPRPGHQHMARWVGRVSAAGWATFTGQAGGFSNAYSCTSTCDGHPSVTLRACAGPNRDDARLDFQLGSRTLSVAFPASTGGTCRAIHVRLRDQVRVSGAWHFRTAQGWSAGVVAGGAFTVDCPPVPAVIVSLHYDCTDVGVSIVLGRHDRDGHWTPLMNPTGHRIVLVVSGSRSQRIVAGQGQSARYTATTTCAAPLRLTARAGIQRADGGYNYGPVSAVTTPG